MLTRDTISWGRLAGLLALFALAWSFWDRAFFHPLRILVTIFHEFGHGAAAVLTGGGIEKITVDPMGGGLCYTVGGWRWVILPAGYLGSMTAGCGILLLACRTRWDRWVSMALGAVLVLACLVFVRSMTGLFYGIAVGLALVAAGRWLNEEVNDFILCFIGATSCLYAVLDIRYLMRLGKGYNDASMMSTEILPLPPFVWAALWAIAAAACLWFTLRFALKNERPSTTLPSGRRF